MPLQEDDIAYMLVQYHEDADQDDMEFQYPDSIALAMADSSKQRGKPPDHHWTMEPNAQSYQTYPFQDSPAAKTLHSDTKVARPL